MKNKKPMLAASAVGVAVAAAVALYTLREPRDDQWCWDPSSGPVLGYLVYLTTYWPSDLGIPSEHTFVRAAFTNCYILKDAHLWGPYAYTVRVVPFDGAYNFGPSSDVSDLMGTMPVPAEPAPTPVPEPERWLMLAVGLWFLAVLVHVREYLRFRGPA